MKKTLKLSLVCAVLFGTSTYAIDGNEDFALHVIKGNGNQVTFALNNVKKHTYQSTIQTVTLSILKVLQAKAES